MGLIISFIRRLIGGVVRNLVLGLLLLLSGVLGGVLSLLELAIRRLDHFNDRHTFNVIAVFGREFSTIIHFVVVHEQVVRPQVQLVKLFRQYSALIMRCSLGLHDAKLIQIEWFRDSVFFPLLVGLGMKRHGGGILALLARQDGLLAELVGVEEVLHGAHPIAGDGAHLDAVLADELGAGGGVGCEELAEAADVFALLDHGCRFEFDYKLWVPSVIIRI